MPGVAGLDGIERARDPSSRLDISMCADGHTGADAKTLPSNLLDALRAPEASSMFNDAFASFVPADVKLRMRQSNDCAGHLGQWETDAAPGC